MIVQTAKEINGVMYDYAYSDSGYIIERDGVRYSEAVDPIDSGRVYTETEEPIETGTDDATANETLIADMAQMIEEVYQSDMEMMGI